MHEVNPRQQSCRDGRIKKKKRKRVRESAGHTFRSIATEGTTQKSKCVQDGSNSDQLLTHVHGIAKVPNRIHNADCERSFLRQLSVYSSCEDKQKNEKKLISVAL